MYDLWIGSTVAALVGRRLRLGPDLLVRACATASAATSCPRRPGTTCRSRSLYTVAPFLIIAVLFYYTAVVQTDVNRAARRTRTSRCQVVAFKWNWQFNYTRRPSDPRTDEPSSTTVGTSDDIPCWCCRPSKTIRFVETRNDVIHSFWVPELLFKRDVFPGRRPEQRVRAATHRRARTSGRCAELCGTYHSMMNFELRVVTAEKYQRVPQRWPRGNEDLDARRR